MIRFLWLLPLFLLIQCKKEEGRIPSVNVNRYLYPSDPIFVNLNAIGGWVYISGGSRGIIVYRSSQDEFKAYDRHCTYQVESECGKVNVDINNVTLRDSCCASEFMIMDGTVSKGPAKYPLKTYFTEYDGNKLHIYN
jgi:nitrite reductase/ring-hydroxylating ferredoxin subunit